MKRSSHYGVIKDGFTGTRIFFPTSARQKIKVYYGGALEMKEEAINHSGWRRRGGGFRFWLDCGDFLTPFPIFFFSTRRKGIILALEILGCIGLLFIVINRDWKWYRKENLLGCNVPLPRARQPRNFPFIYIYIFFLDCDKRHDADSNYILDILKNRLAVVPSRTGKPAKRCRI